MRPLAGLAIAVIVSGPLSCGVAVAQTSAVTADSAALLMDAAFSHDQITDPAFAARPTDAALLDHRRPTLMSLNQAIIHANADGSAVDTLKVSETLRTPSGLPLNLERGQRDYEVRLIRDWPDAVSFENERYDLRVSPHAGVGVSSFGGSAEAGAVLTLGRKSQDESVAARLDRMGVHDGAAFGDTGRWYLFAAASGRAVGLNMLRDSTAGWDRSWSQDSSSALIGDAQLGVGWRKGSMQTSLGYVHREVKGAHMLWGQEAKDDSMVAFSLSIKPRH